MALPIIAVLSTFTTAGFATYMFFSTRHRERMALIENGADAKIFNQSLSPLPNLKWGMVLVAIGLAIFVGGILEERAGLEDGVGFFGMVFLFGGLALLLFYGIVRNQPRSEF